MTDVEFIQDFLRKMREQDRRGTADPYFYVIRTKITEPAPLENCDESRFYWRDETYESKEEIRETCKECDLVFDVIENEITEYGIRFRWDKRGMFLTEDDAKAHLRLNHYHYSPDAHTYVEHAWRAPQLERFFKALHAHFAGGSQ